MTMSNQRQEETLNLNKGAKRDSDTPPTPTVPNEALQTIDASKPDTSPPTTGQTCDFVVRQGLPAKLDAVADRPTGRQ
jgi:hypothetical protein